MKVIQDIISAFKEGTLSLFSDGKFSMKRLIGFMFAIAVLRMTWYILNHIVPTPNQVLFEHCFDMLCYIMTALLIGATWKDIMAMRTEGKVEETKTVQTQEGTTIEHKSLDTTPNE